MIEPWERRRVRGGRGIERETRSERENNVAHDGEERLRGVLPRRKLVLVDSAMCNA
jgi:hypothetical protein